MNIPTLEELIEKRKARKKSFKEAFGGDKVYKVFLEQEEHNISNFILNNFYKLDQDDQEYVKNNSRSSTMYIAFSFTPLIGLSLYTAYKRPVLSFRQKLLLWVPAIILYPSLAISNSIYNAAHIELYLMEKYRTRFIDGNEESLENN